MSNAVVTIGNTTAQEFADWLDDRFPVCEATIIDGIGYWSGERETCVVVTFYGRTPEFAKGVLMAYGSDHPEEEAFGLCESTFSQLFVNQYHAPDANITIPDTIPEDWN